MQPLLARSLAIYYPTRSFYPILQPMWLPAMCHSPSPTGIDQWTYSWPQNFGTGHKLHKTKPEQTGEAEKAAMKCIGNALKFHKLCGPAPRQISAPHILVLRFHRFPEMTAVPRPILAYSTSVILAAVEKGIIAKVNSRQNGQWLWQRNGKISQLVTRTLRASER